MSTARARLAGLRGRDLARLHAAGTCPDLAELSGELDGEVLTGHLARPGVRGLRIWRGKVFDHDAGRVGGLNRLGVGPWETRRYRFEARIDRSSFADRDVVLLDHDRASNPDFVRRFHDELVQIDEGLHLATSHHRTADGLRFLAFFALAAPQI